MANFSIVKKGYDVKQVDGYISKLVGATEEKLSEQKRRIEELRNENKLLEERLKEYAERENHVAEVLIMANKKAEEIINASKMRFALESERIRLYRDKWTAYVESASEKAAELDNKVNMRAYLTKIDDELSEIIAGDLNIRRARPMNEAEQQFMSERERLKKNVKQRDEKIKVKEKNKDETAADKDDEYLKRIRSAVNVDIRRSAEDDKPIPDEEAKIILPEEPVPGENEIAAALNGGKSLSDICREMGII